jgi:peptide alpha-N-acetyltransferase
MDFARDLDLADRWLNTKSAKYFLLADDVPKADSTIGLFTSKDCDPQTALFDMQCMWFEQEAGESYMRQKRYAPALRKLTSIYQVRDHLHPNQ